MIVTKVIKIFFFIDRALLPYKGQMSAHTFFIVTTYLFTVSSHCLIVMKQGILTAKTKISNLIWNMN
jgi:hypothetical protein